MASSQTSLSPLYVIARSRGDEAISLKARLLRPSGLAMTGGVLKRCLVVALYVRNLVELYFPHLFFAGAQILRSLFTDAHAAAASQELNVHGDDLKRVAFLPVLFPATGLQASLDKHRVAFLKVLVANFGHAAPDDDFNEADFLFL